MSTPLGVLLKADPRLEDGVADDKADPSVCLQLNQISVLQYILETAASMDHQHVLRKAVFFKEVLATVVALFLQTGKGGEWQVIWCLMRSQIIHDVGSLCISTMWLLKFFLVKRTLKQELLVKEKSGKRNRGEFDQHTIPSSTTRLSFTIPYLLFHSISYSSSSLSFFSSSSSSCSSSLRMFGKPPGPPSSPARTCRIGTGLLLPQVPKY